MSDPPYYDRPVLVLDPGMHTSIIRRAAIDRAGRIVATAAEDKTVRIWSLADGALLHLIRLPSGPGEAGKAFAVAVSPDGGLVAAGGMLGGGTQLAPDLALYLFDAATGAVAGRLDGIPGTPGHLAFSPAGDRLAAVFGYGGMRLYARGPGGWALAAEDLDYGDSCFGAAFAADGRLATASYDGGLRIYDGGGVMLQRVMTGRQPYAVAFHPTDGRLAVGFNDGPGIGIFEAATLAPLPAPAGSELEGRIFSAVAWSADGACLFGAGIFMDDEGTPVLAWRDGIDAAPQVLRAGNTTVMSLVALPDGSLLVAAGDPWLGVIEPDGRSRWIRPPPQIDVRDQKATLAVSDDGMTVEFGLRRWGEDRRRMDLAALRLGPPVDDAGLRTPVQDDIPVAGWNETTAPSVGGVALALDRFERSSSIAMHPDGKRFVLGADWSVRAFDLDGTELWMRQVPGTVWAVNVTGDGRLAVVAYGDGTLRWHRVADGAELLALFPMPNGEDWVAWTPEGVYAATPGARRVLRWHVNHGWDAAEAISVEAIPETCRPEVIRHVLPQLGTAGAIAVTELAKIRGAVQRATGADVTPGARLHVLAIGVSDYGAAARHLDLAYADQDARDVAAALRDSQGGLYARVLPSVLVNEQATRMAILAELNALAAAMQQGGGQDVAVVLFSGHGEMVDEDEFYLIPHGVDASSSDALLAAALPGTQFHDRLAKVARQGRVLLFLDACFSGGATVPLDRSLRAMREAPNLSIFASASPRERSLERSNWQNGALAEALLAALREADEDHDGLIRVSDLSRFLSERIPGLTAGDQHPEVEIRFDRKVLAAML